MGALVSIMAPKRRKREPEPESEEEEEELMDEDEEEDEAADGDDAGDDGAEEGDEEVDDEHEADLAALQAVFVEKQMGAAKNKAAVNDVEGLAVALASVADDKPWLETLDFVHQGGEDFNMPEDDAQREKHFQAAAKVAATACIVKLNSAGAKHRRPEDYYAEMCKTDHHMGKVKSKLVHEKSEIVDAENRRKLRDAKKFGKQVQHAKEKQFGFGGKKKHSKRNTDGAGLDEFRGAGGRKGKGGNKDGGKGGRKGGKGKNKGASRPGKSKRQRH